MTLHSVIQSTFNTESYTGFLRNFVYVKSLDTRLKKFTVRSVRPQLICAERSHSYHVYLRVCVSPASFPAVWCACGIQKAPDLLMFSLISSLFSLDKQLPMTRPIHWLTIVPEMGVDLQCVVSTAVLYWLFHTGSLAWIKGPNHAMITSCSDSFADDNSQDTFKVFTLLN